MDGQWTTERCMLMTGAECYQPFRRNARLGNALRRYLRCLYALQDSRPSPKPWSPICISMCIYRYIMYMYVCIYIYIYTYRQHIHV